MNLCNVRSPEGIARIAINHVRSIEIYLNGKISDNGTRRHTECVVS